MHYDFEQLAAFGFIEELSYTSGKYIVKVKLPYNSFKVSCNADEFKALICTINIIIKSLKEESLNKDNKKNQQSKEFDSGYQSGYKAGLKEGYNIGFDDGFEEGHSKGFVEGLYPSN